MKKEQNVNRILWIERGVILGLTLLDQISTSIFLSLGHTEGNRFGIAGFNQVELFKNGTNLESHLLNVVITILVLYLADKLPKDGENIPKLENLILKFIILACLYPPVWNIYIISQLINP